MRKTRIGQKKRIAAWMSRARTLTDKIETARRSAKEVRQLAQGLKSELKETINLLNAIHQQMQQQFSIPTKSGCQPTCNKQNESKSENIFAGYDDKQTLNANQTINNS